LECMSGSSVNIVRIVTEAVYDFEH